MPPAAAPLPEPWPRLRPDPHPDPHAPGGDTRDDGPSRTRIYRRVLEAIRDGSLPAGARVPAARVLARGWGVARGAVDEALARLQREGLLERRVGRGTHVAQHVRAGPAEPARARLNPASRAALARLTPLLRRPLEALPPATLASRAGVQGPRLRLRPRASELSTFPLAAWRRQLQRTHDDADRATLCYGMPAGWPGLREATARHLALTRSIRCSADQVMIVNNQMQGLDLLARVLLEPGARVVVEDPSYMSIGRWLSLAQMQVIGVPVDHDGLDIAAARARVPDPSMIVLHPVAQYPTGAFMSPERRAALLQWAEETGAWVVEGDHLGEIVHDGAAPAALQSADRQARVVYLGGFTNIMFPSLRLVYLVLPERLVDVFGAVRGMYGDHGPTATQQAMAGFIDEGHLAAHLRGLRAIYRERRDRLRDAAHAALPPGLTLGPMRGGLHACLGLPRTADDVAIAARLAGLGFGLEPLSAYAWADDGRRGLVLGYGGDDAAEIGDAVARLGEELAALL